MLEIEDQPQKEQQPRHARGGRRLAKDPLAACEKPVRVQDLLVAAAERRLIQAPGDFQDGVIQRISVHAAQRKA